MTLNTETVTSHDSGGWVEIIPTLLEAGEMTFDVNYYKATTQTRLRTAQTDRTRLNFQDGVPANRIAHGHAGIQRLRNGIPGSTAHQLRAC